MNSVKGFVQGILLSGSLATLILVCTQLESSNPLIMVPFIPVVATLGLMGLEYLDGK